MKDCKSLAECIAEVVTRMSGQNEGAVELQTAEDDPAVRQFYNFRAEGQQVRALPASLCCDP